MAEPVVFKTLLLECNPSYRVELAQGDITELECDAIVNAANSLMIMGGGVAGAIRRKGGEEIEREARRHAPVPVGRAIVTGAGKLSPRIKAVIHAPTMERPAMRTTVEKVKKATRAALEVAAEKGFECIAFPAMGAGVGGVPVADAVQAMLEVIEEFLSKNPGKPNRILLVAYTEGDKKRFEKAVAEHLRRSKLVEKEACEKEETDSSTRSEE